MCSVLGKAWLLSSVSAKGVEEVCLTMHTGFGCFVCVHCIPTVSHLAPVSDCVHYLVAYFALVLAF